VLNTPHMSAEYVCYYCFHCTSLIASFLVVPTLHTTCLLQGWSRDDCWLHDEPTGHPLLADRCSKIELSSFVSCTTHPIRERPVWSQDRHLEGAVDSMVGDHYPHSPARRMCSAPYIFGISSEGSFCWRIRLATALYPLAALLLPRSVV